MPEPLPPPEPPQLPEPELRTFTGRLLEVIDGLLLGKARLNAVGVLVLDQAVRHLTWVRMVEAEFVRGGVACTVTVPASSGPVRLVTAPSPELARQHARWYDGGGAKAVPPDVRLGALSLAYWFACDGARASSGYSARLCTRFTRAECEFLARRLGEVYGWRGEVFEDRGSSLVRFSRSGDRLALRRLITSYVPASLQHKLVLRESAPCSEAEAARRRRPWVLDRDAAAAIRRRAAAGEPYAVIARDYNVGARFVGKIARGERWKSGRQPGALRRAPTRRLTRAELETIARRLADGETQLTVARSLGIPQSRVSWLKVKGKLPPPR